MHDMYKSINVDAAVEHLKYLVDSIRCAVCDRTDGTRMRYACGHTSCEDCVVIAADCSVCLTPPQSTSREPVVDKPFTQRVADAVNLLNVFQNEFHIDVYKRHRISEQLKVEKELFPECIQAPSKYYNKRKSYMNTKLDKENRLSQLPGEEVSPFSNYKMEKRNEIVEIWLNKHMRKPFAELNTNDETLRKNTRAIKKQQNTSNNENAPLKRSNKKRSHSKTKLSVKNQPLIVDHLSPMKKTKKQDKEPSIKKICIKPETTSSYVNTSTNINTNDNDESGIVMDDEAVIVIDDSQSITVDKDRDALLAVHEAERKKQYESTSPSLINSRSIEFTSQKDNATDAERGTNVPFYLKGYFSDNCIDCNDDNCDISESVIESNNKKSATNTESAKDVSITVENKSFITVINIKQIDNKQTTGKKNCMQSVEVQTDTIDRIIVNENVQETPSQDIFQDGESENADKGFVVKSLNKTENVIIEESDSDDDVEASISMEVKAEIHRSCEEIDYGILADVDNLGEHSKRARRAPRGVTPTSSNSSEKENYNPNKMKKAPTSKKKPMKK